MKLTQNLRDERAFVHRSLGDSMICERCGATLDTYADTCSAALAEMCPGFVAIEAAREEFRKART